ncbi:hypothetical protein HDV05_005224 [Chytridiales sp. JEL 0842]|nr:hypothetical protein HDV05_005224 [Chytridiales sp. JEL 0842]
MSLLQGLKTLADMNARSACPRCEGYGFTHDTFDKHDKPDARTRCKKCGSCKVCSGSGVVTDKVGCKACKGRGFIHPINNVLARPHSTPDPIKCPDCVECKECAGVGAFDLGNKRVSKVPVVKKGNSVTVAPAQGLRMSVLPGGGLGNRASMMSMGQSGGGGEGEVGQGQVEVSGEQVVGVGSGTVRPEDSGYPAWVQPTKCPRCLGKNGLTFDSMRNRNVVNFDVFKTTGNGWKHDTSAKHDKPPPARCKSCTSCKSCNSTGIVIAKIPCPTCNMLCFIHSNPERAHDAPDKLRCFWCKDCTTCKGVGVIEDPEIRNMIIKEEKERKALLAKQLKEQKRALKLQQQQQQQQAAAAAAAAAMNPFMAAMMMMNQQQQQPTPSNNLGLYANAPGAPPTLPVFMALDPSTGKHVHMVRPTEGGELVPVEQVMKRLIPMTGPPPGMVPNSMMPGMVPGMMPGMMPVGMGGMPAGFPGAPNPMMMPGMMMGAGMMPPPPPAPPQQASSLGMMEREAVLKDVWG